MSKSIGSELCEALGLKRCVSVKLEVGSDVPFLMVTAVQYLDHNQFHPVDKVLRKYRLELISEQPLPTPEKEVFLGERVHTFRLPTHSPESDPT